MSSPMFALALLGALAGPAAAAGFTDPVVDPASYTRLVLFTDPSVQATVSATPLGNPGPGLQISFTNNGGPILLTSVLGFVRQDFSWNPATQGAIATVSFSNDRYVDGGDDFVNTNLVTFSRALVVQGGQAFVATIPDSTQVRQTWFTTSAVLNATSFSAFDFNTGASDPARQPDFSAAGAPLQFGFINRYGQDSVGLPYTLNALFRFDNIAISLTPVPEPASAWLVLAGLAVLARRVRQQRQAG